MPGRRQGNGAATCYAAVMAQRASAGLRTPRPPQRNWGQTFRFSFALVFVEQAIAGELIEDLKLKNEKGKDPTPIFFCFYRALDLGRSGFVSPILNAR